jgi:hypothetical protein
MLILKVLFSEMDLAESSFFLLVVIKEGGAEVFRTICSSPITAPLATASKFVL